MVQQKDDMTAPDQVYAHTLSSLSLTGNLYLCSCDKNVNEIYHLKSHLVLQSNWKPQLLFHKVAEFGKVSSKGYAADWSDLKVKSLA